MKKKIKVLFFNFKSDSYFRTRILDKIQVDYDVTITDTKIQKEAISYLKDNPKTIFVFNAETISEYMQSRTILSDFKNHYRSELYSIGVLDSINDDISSSLKKLGCKKLFSKSAQPSDIEKTIRRVIENTFEATPVYELPKSALAIEMDVGTGDQCLRCNLDSFSDNNLLVELEGNGNYNPGDRIKLRVVFEYDNCKVDLMIDGTIEHIEKTDLPSVSMLNMNLSSSESLSLENFMLLYQKKQDSINEFMSLAKGA